MISYLRRVAFPLLLVLGLGSAWADEFLAPEQAFKLAVKVADAQSVDVQFVIAPGHYMYRSAFKFEVQDGSLGEIQIPPGKKKFDEALQKEVEVYRHELTVHVPVAQAGATVTLMVTGQGCADKGLCYPPMTRGVSLQLSGFGGKGSAELLPVEDGAGSFGAADAVAASVGLPSNADQGKEPAAGSGDRPGGHGWDALLQTGRFWTVVALFFVAGIGLSLTPCVLPMVPILASIIVGGGASVSRGRGFALALVYSQGMALVYTALGLAAGLAGEGFAAYFQTPWVLATFGVALVLFSLSMFDAYELRLPSRWADSVNEQSQKLEGGRFAAVFAMGALSALLVSPCVTGVLASALLYLSKTHDVLLGGGALYALANGMSVPLLLIGLSAGTLLPKAGPWMDGVKHLFGLALLGLALWTVQPLLGDALLQALLGLLLVGISLALGLLRPWHASMGPKAWLRRAVAMAAMFAGLMQWAGAATGGTDVLRPLAGLRLVAASQAAAQQGTAQAAPVQASSEGLAFTQVHDVAELDHLLQTSAKPVMLDFYADWCKSCKEMERLTFSQAAVQQRLAGALLLKADVTANGPADRELLKRFNLFGPPGTIFFKPGGAELQGQRVIGFQDADEFLKSLAAAGI